MDVLYRYDLSISGLRLRLETDLPIRMEDKFRPFLSDFDTAELTARFRRRDVLPPLSPQVLLEERCYRVHPNGRGGYLRSFFDPPRDRTPYALSSPGPDGSCVDIDYLPKGVHCLQDMNTAFVHIGLESLLLSRDRLCLHAACICTELGGIVFSGPSGIGKSTQAGLWCAQRSARQINGDRPILSRTEDGWLAWGSPFAGSSNCYVNECCPVRAIVMLRQAKECTLRRLGPSEAFRAIWSGLTVQSWDRTQTERASGLALELSLAVPVYELACTPDLRAVELLENTLREECP